MLCPRELFRSLGGSQVAVRVTLRLLRQAKHLSLKAVGAMVGVSDNTISRWERGVYQPSSVEAERYAAALGVTQRQVNRLLATMRGKDAAVETPDGDTAAV
jgi:transcriptional regulator with XRE-family HTH domain